MSTYLTLPEYEAIHGAVSTTDRPRIQFLLDVAEAKLLGRVPSIPRRVDDGTLDVLLVKGALADIVHRVTTTPDPYVQSQTTTTGPFSTTRQWSADRVYVSASDVRDLLPPARKAPRPIQQAIPAWRVP